MKTIIENIGEDTITAGRAEEVAGGNYKVITKDYTLEYKQRAGTIRVILKAVNYHYKRVQKTFYLHPTY